MPSSPLYTITGIMKAVAEIKPKSVLDIGMGFGKFGFLIREYFDLRPGKKAGYDTWSMKIDGIEIFEEYITEVHRYIYDEIYIGDAIEIISKHNFYYDMIIAVDLLEHLSRKDGFRLIEKMKGIADNILISTPSIYFEQDEMFENRHEKHLSGWDVDDFMNLGFRYIWQVGVSMVGVYTEKNPDLPEAPIIREKNISQQDAIKIRNLLKRYFETGQYEECIDAGEKYLPNMQISSPELFLFLAASYERGGNAVKSLENAEKVLELDGSNRDALDIMQRLKKE